MRDRKAYEMISHTSNVIATVSDRKIGVENTGDNVVDFYSSEILSAQDYYVYHSTMPSRSFSSKPYRYGGSNGQEKDNEIFEGAYTAEFWEYDSRRGGRMNPDPVVNPSVSPYACFNDNPILMVDINGAVATPPDDIYLNEKGEVEKIIETNKPNRFFDKEGKELSLNDPDNLDSPMLVKQFEKGEKVFEPISRNESQGVLDATKSLDFKKEVNSPSDVGMYLIKYALYSHGRYDFGFYYLQDRLEVTDAEMADLYYDSGYIDGLPFVKFEGKNILYNLPDAGNFLWGKKAKDNNLPKPILIIGADANEGGKDTPADTKAILDGYGY